MYQSDYNQQIYFAQELDQINQIYIKTSYGNIFAHCVGKHGQPLIIVVHGSGPKNSGDQYLYFLHEYLVRVSYIQKFFIISIDCPGYGRSKGSKQAVKTFPLQMFKQILQDLRYDHYYAMLGHSQGGAAIFNAVYQDPKLTEFLLMDRPVCGNIKRFNKFPIPTLLLYDIQDDGHPIWQGKLLYKQLASSQFYTYRNSQYTYWVPDHIWNLTLALFKKYSSQRKTLMTGNFSRGLLNHRSQSTKKDKYRAKSQQQKNKKYKKKAQSLSKCDQIKKQREKSQKDLKQIKEVDKSEIYSKISDLQQFQDLPVWLNQPKIQQTEEQVMQQNLMKKKQEERLKQKIKVVVEDSKDAKDQIKLQKKQIKQVKQIKQEKKTQKIVAQQKKSPQQEKKQLKKSEKSKQNLQDQNKCSICYELYYYPLETNCKHIFCKKCIGQALLIDKRCPLCRTNVAKKQYKEQLQNKILQNMQEKQKSKRAKQLKDFETMLKSIIYIQIGNNSRELATKKSPFSKTKTKYIWQVYVKQPKNSKFQEVGFNINMGDRDSKPVKVTNAPFVFQSRGTFSFSCQITIKPRNHDYAPITAIYRIDVTPGNHSKIIALKKKKN